MSDLHESYRPEPTLAEGLVVDEGLRSYMLSVYNKVALGLLLAAGLAYLTSSVPVARDHLGVRRLRQ